MRIIKAILFRLTFLIMLLFGVYYTLSVQTEKFYSSGVIMVKDLSQDQSISMLGSLLSPEGSGTTRDSKLLELYILSGDMYRILDGDFNLTNYYTSSRIDILQRLYYDTVMPYFQASDENLLERYGQDITMIYDEPSGTLSIGFLHIDAGSAQKIVFTIIKQCAHILNLFERESAKEVLSFLEKQETQNRVRFIKSTEKLVAYQDIHNTIDPSIDAKAKGTILANLESELIKKEVEYTSKLIHQLESSPTMRSLMITIEEIKKSIQKLKSEMVGGTDQSDLNVNIVAYELLKSDVDFNKLLYQQTLVKLEETKVTVSQNAKNLIIVSRPEVSDRYNSPDKFSQIMTLFIIIGFLYGIVSLILSILRDHRD